MSLDKKTLQYIIDAGRSAKPQHWGGAGENMVYLTPEMYAAIEGVLKADQSISCKEGAEETKESAIHQIQWHGNKHWIDVPREEYIALKSLHNEDMQSRIVHLNALDRQEVVEEAYRVCMALSHKYGLEGCDALQSAAGILRTRLKKGSVGVALDFIKGLKEYEPENEGEPDCQLCANTGYTQSGNHCMECAEDADPQVEAMAHIVEAVKDACETRNIKFDLDAPGSTVGRLLIEECAEARQNALEEAAKMFDALGSKLAAGQVRALAKDEESSNVEVAVEALKKLHNLEEAVKVFEKAACHDTYKVRDGVAAVLEFARSGDEIPVEIWHGLRKVSIYKDHIIRVWEGNAVNVEIDEVPRTLQAVQDTVDWVYRSVDNPVPYTSRLTELQNDNLDVRILTVAKKYAQRSLNLRVWSIENHKLFLMMREFLDEEISNAIGLWKKLDGPLDRSKFTIEPVDPRIMSEERRKETYRRLGIETDKKPDQEA